MYFVMQLPNGATCVWKGHVMSAWTREQEMFDGSIKNFEVMKRFDSIQCIWIQGDKIVLPYEIQPHQATWRYGLWGGMLEEGEEPLDAMKREFLEETGMTGDFSSWLYLEKGGFVIRNEHHYIIRNPHKIQTTSLDVGGEKIEPKELTFDEFLQVVSSASFRNSGFSAHIMREYIVPNKTQELYNILFKNTTLTTSIL